MDNISLVSTFWTLLIIGATYFVYQRIVKPYKVYCFYKKFLCEHYRTEVGPFTILGIDYIARKNKNLEKYGDSIHFAKTKLPNYQVRLLKIGAGIVIDLIDPELIKEFF
jgi:hypothetical protein